MQLKINTASHYLFWLALLFLLWSCAPTADYDIWWSKSTATDFAAGETSHIAAGILGIKAEDYPKIADKASQGNINAIREIQRVTGHGDAAGSLGQSMLLQKILEQVGDSLFAEALLTQPNEVILAHGFLRNPNYQVSITQENFPKTYQIIELAESRS